MNDALFWLLLNLTSVIALAFYSMLEMACVSFNKVRLQYYVSKKNQRALWLNKLLQNPSLLFGTTLIGVNVATVIGSECAREFHSAIGIDPNWAPLSQVIIVVIFGELAPMFAARCYPEHVAMLGIPIIYASSIVMSPIIWMLSVFSRWVSYFIGGAESDPNLYLSQEELQQILEEQDEEHTQASDNTEFNAIAANIFRLRGKTVKEVMLPINSIPLLASNAIVKQMKNLLQRTGADWVPIYYRQHSNIVAIAFPRETVKAPDNKRVRDFARSPWFITGHTKLTEVLKQFRSNNENVAVVLDDTGAAIGVITLDDVIEEIFGKAKGEPIKTEHSGQVFLIERTFPGNMLVKDFNLQFGVVLSLEVNLTLSELLQEVLGHPPEEGDVVSVGNFELGVKKSSILGVKRVSITSKRR
ncbi:MAG: HlyC/CorC family transporter [Chlamydiales bacterium]|nr:HlyC/CorC family transporter [Chlamydiia bacterium]MCP5508435.1 HlyC/CorC family transporter [Chlamydiales bacterium]